MARRIGKWHGSVVLAACASALVFAQVPAHAQGATSAAAEQLFQDAKRLLDAGRVHDACEKFAASQEAEPGLGTLLHLAACHEKEGKTASAWAEFNDAMAQAQNRGEKDREKFAREHASALEKQLHRVVLDMTQRPEGLEIKLDGKLFPVGSLGTAIPLDPGAHTLEARATKKKVWTQKMTLAANAATERVDIPAMVDDPTAPEPAAQVGGPKVIVVDKGVPPDYTKRWIGVALGVGGLVAGGVAVWEALTAVERDRASQENTDSANTEPNPAQKAKDLDVAKTNHDQATTAQTYGIILGAGGAVALGVGIYLFVTSFGSGAKVSTPTTGLSVAPLFGKGHGGLSLTGTF